MFGGLRTRLMASYILIILLTLAVIGVALFFVLRTSPQTTQAQTTRLYNLLTNIDTLRETRGGNNPGDDLPPAQKLAFTQLDKRTGLRILFFNADRSVVFDSQRLNQPGSRLLIDDVKPYTQPGQDSKQFPLVMGTMRSPDGADWLFMAQAATDSSARMLLMVATPAPHTLSGTEMLQYYEQDLGTPLLEAGLIGLVVAFGLSLLITRSVARPLQDVATAAASLAQGNLDQKAPIRGPHEVRTVAEAFNQMAQQMQESQKAQRDFLANVTHDLRTPLTSIQGFSQAIIDGVASNPGAAQRAAQIIHDEAGRLNRMVQELLDLARIEAGRFSMTRHSIRLSDVLVSVGERLTPRAAEKGLTLSIDVPTLPLIAGDGDRLVQVYTNLIDNAIKHTPTGGTVSLRAAVQDNGVMAQVIDTGEGIPAADLPHIFDRFYQVDKSRQRERREGAGLGLTITKGIIDAHGGKLWVQSQEGTGTVFSTWFPAVAPDATTVIRRRSGIFKTPTPRPTVER